MDKRRIYYVYRHIRDDRNEPFYVGQSCYTEGEYNYYKRAFCKRRRTKYWKEIVKSTTFAVEIIYETYIENDAIAKEKEFISLYGRIDLGNGTLVNMTSGGWKGNVKSRTSVEQQLKTAKETGVYFKNIERIKKYSYKKGGSTQHKDFYVYDLKGKKISTHKSVKDFGNLVGICPSNISSCAGRKQNYGEYLFSYTDLGEFADISKFNIRKPAFRQVVIIDIYGNEYNFSKQSDAAKYLGVSKEIFWQKMKSNKPIKEYVIVD